MLIKLCKLINLSLPKILLSFSLPKVWKIIFFEFTFYLFQGEKELFKGLYVYDKWHLEHYPIINIPFFNIGCREMGLNKAIDLKLEEIGRAYDIILSAESNSKNLKNLQINYNPKTIKT